MADSVLEIVHPKQSNLGNNHAANMQSIDVLPLSQYPVDHRAHRKVTRHDIEHVVIH